MRTEPEALKQLILPTNTLHIEVILHMMLVVLIIQVPLPRFFTIANVGHAVHLLTQRRGPCHRSLLGLL